MQCALSDNTPDCDHKGKLLSLLLFPGVDDLGPFQKQATLIKAYRRKVVAIVRIYSGMLEPWAWGAISPQDIPNTSLLVDSGGGAWHWQT